MDKKWRLQFSLRSLLLLVVAISSLFAFYYRWHIRPQRIAVALEEQGNVVIGGYDAPAQAPSWLRNWLVPYQILSIEGIWDIDDDAIALLNQCRSLTYLAICDSNLDSAAFSQLATFPECRTLCLTGSNVVDQDLEQIAKSMPNLTHLDVAETKLTPHGLAAIAKLSKLESVSIDGRLLTEEGVKRLGASVTLTHISIDAGTVDDQSILGIIAHTKIESLTLPIQSEVPDEILEYATDSGLQIRILRPMGQYFDELPPLN